MGPSDVLALLKSIEWRMPNAQGKQEWCPACNGHISNGHEFGCRLAASITYMEEEDKARQALQAIAGAEPAHYDDDCFRCRELIAMAREGTETGA